MINIFSRLKHRRIKNQDSLISDSINWGFYRHFLGEKVNLKKVWWYLWHLVFFSSSFLCFFSKYFPENSIDIYSCPNYSSYPNLGTEMGIVLNQGTLHKRECFDFENLSNVLNIWSFNVKSLFMVQYVQLSINCRMGSWCNENKFVRW